MKAAKALFAWCYFKTLTRRATETTKLLVNDMALPLACRRYEQLTSVRFQNLSWGHTTLTLNLAFFFH